MLERWLNNYDDTHLNKRSVVNECSFIYPRRFDELVLIFILFKFPVV